MSLPNLVHANPELPATLVGVLLTHLKSRYLRRGRANSPWNERDTEYFSRGIIKLNRAFTENRAGRYTDYFSDPVMRSGYLAYFFPVNLMKFAGILRRFDHVTASPSEIRIADIGAGPLTASFGFLLSRLTDQPTTKIKITIDAFELNKKILDDGTTLLREFVSVAGLANRFEVRVNPIAGNFFKKNSSKRHYDYIFMGNFLNEFDSRDTLTDIVLGVLKRFSGTGTKIVMLEPGSKKITRDLQHIRDVVISETDHVVLAPCLHQETCPLNITAKSDWCNFTQRWRAPQFIKDFDEATALRKAYLIYSFLFLKNGVMAKTPSRAQGFVAISDIMIEKGRLSIVGCGAAGRIRFIRANKDRSEMNSSFDLLHRGKYFSALDFTPSGEFELDKNVMVKKGDRIIFVDDKRGERE